MNLCFLYGEIISEIKFDFFYNSNRHISIVEFLLRPNANIFQNTNREIIIKIKAFDGIADMIYQNFEKGDFIKVIGYFDGEYVIIR